MEERPGATMLARPSLRVWAPGLAAPIKHKDSYVLCRPIAGTRSAGPPVPGNPAASRLPHLPIRRPDGVGHNSALCPKKSASLSHSLL